MLLNMLHYKIALFFSISLIFSSFFTILINNPVYSILFLILSFVSATGILILLESEFMAFIFIVIYIGAIAVLFLFVVMLLNIKIVDSIKDVLKYFPISNFIGFFILLEILIFFINYFKFNPYFESFLFNVHINWLDKIDSVSDIQSIGQIIYTYYVLQFLIAGFILLISILGAVILTLSYNKVNLKKQDSFKQTSR
jgi:NADH-quinone oxidoreductase subunit J